MELLVPADAVAEWLADRRMLQLDAKLRGNWRAALLTLRQTLQRLTSQICTERAVHDVDALLGSALEEACFLHFLRVLTQDATPCTDFPPVQATLLSASSASGLSALLTTMRMTAEPPRAQLVRTLQDAHSRHLSIADVGVYMRSLVTYTLPERRAELFHLARTHTDLQRRADEAHAAASRNAAELGEELRSLGVSDASAARVAIVQRAVGVYAAEARVIDDALRGEGVQRALAHYDAVWRHIHMHSLTKYGISVAQSQAPQLLRSADVLAGLQYAVTATGAISDAWRQELICDALELRAFFSQRVATATASAPPDGVDMMSDAPADVFSAGCVPSSMQADIHAAEALHAALTHATLENAVLLATDEAAVQQREVELTSLAARIDHLRKQAADAAARATTAKLARAACLQQYNDALRELTQLAAFVQEEVSKLLPKCRIIVTGIPDALT